MASKVKQDLLEKVFFRVLNWFKNGSLPPRTHYYSLGLMLLLLTTGICAFTVSVLSYFEIAFDDVISSPVTLFGISLLALMPGVYVAGLSILAWRRYPGYSWQDIPYAE